MATANDVITRALRLIGVIGAGETPDADMTSDGLASLNDLLAALNADGITLGTVDMALSDTFTVPREHIRGIRYMLAVEMAPEYEKEPPPAVVAGADHGYRAMQAAYASAPEIGVDRGLLHMPSRCWGTGSLR